MFKKKHELLNVNHSFALRRDELYTLLTTGEVLKYDMRSGERVWKSNITEKSSIIGFLNEAIFCNVGFETNILNPLSGNIVSQHKFKVIYPLPNIGSFLAQGFENEKKVLYLINEKFDSLLKKEIKLGKTILVDNGIVINTKYLNDQIIIGYDLQSFEELWYTNIAQYSQFRDIYQELQEGLITHILGVYGDVLWLGLSSGKLIGLNIKTGEVNHKIGFKESSLLQLLHEVKEEDYLVFGEFMQLDKTKGEIMGLRDKYFMKVDVKLPVLMREYIDVSESMKIHKISSSYRNYDFPYDAQFIYFCDDRQGKIGVFDRGKKEVVWSYEIEIKRDGIAQILDMKYSDNRWYILDRDNTLHIFEREL